MADDAFPSVSMRGRLVSRWEFAPKNSFGAGAGIVGILVAEVFSELTLQLSYAFAGNGHTPSMLAREVTGVIGLWIGFVGTALWASMITSRDRSLSERLRTDFGFSIRARDVPLGIVVGLFGQYVLTTLFELPLYPFVPHLFRRLGAPARSLTSGESGAALVLLGVLVCLGSPLVEELFFRGLFLRGLLGIARGRLGWRAVPAVLASAAVSGLVFGLIHAEPLQLLALAGFGMLLALVACSTGRLGAGIVAHVTFNSLTFIALAMSH